MAAAAAPSVSPSPAPAPAPKVVSPKAGDRKVVPVDAVAVEVEVEVEMEVELKLELEEKHVLAVDDSSVDRAVIAKILRSSKYRGEQSMQLLLLDRLIN